MSLCEQELSQTEKRKTTKTMLWLADTSTNASCVKQKLYKIESNWSLITKIARMRIEYV